LTELSPADRTELEQLKARYCRLVDTKRWDDWRELFADDARIEVSADGETTDRDTFVSSVVRMVDPLQTVHHCMMPELTATGDGAAHGVWAYRYELEWRTLPVVLPFNQLPRQHGFAACGHYHEDYTRRDGAWRISFLRTTQLAGWALVGATGLVAL
jgi:hypothetical protein